MLSRVDLFSWGFSKYETTYGRANKVGVITHLNKAFFSLVTVSNRQVTDPFINFIHDIVHFACISLYTAFRNNADWSSFVAEANRYGPCSST